MGSTYPMRVITVRVVRIIYMRWESKLSWETVCCSSVDEGEGVRDSEPRSGMLISGVLSEAVIRRPKWMRGIRFFKSYLQTM